MLVLFCIMFSFFVVSANCIKVCQICKVMHNGDEMKKFGVTLVLMVTSCICIQCNANTMLSQEKVTRSSSLAAVCCYTRTRPTGQCYSEVAVISGISSEYSTWILESAINIVSHSSWPIMWLDFKKILKMYWLRYKTSLVYIWMGMLAQGQYREEPRQLCFY